MGVLSKKQPLDWPRMDRTMYGKVLPGTYYPFRCAMKENGISPGCEYIIYYCFFYITYIDYICDYNSDYVVICRVFVVFFSNDITILFTTYIHMNIYNNLNVKISR